MADALAHCSWYRKETADIPPPAVLHLLISGALVRSFMQKGAGFVDVVSGDDSAFERGGRKGYGLFNQYRHIFPSWITTGKHERD